MKMPNAQLAVVEKAKIVEYLLNRSHPYGSSKAKFFIQFCFHLEAWEAFAVALRQHGQQYEVSKTKQTGFGPRYEIDGDLRAPDGRFPRVRTVWQLDEGSIAPRLITAYPVQPL